MNSFASPIATPLRGIRCGLRLRGGPAVGPALRQGPARLGAVPRDLAFGLQLEEMRVYLALRHLDQTIGSVGVERADDLRDRRRLDLQELEDLAFAHLPVRDVLLEHL